MKQVLLSAFFVCCGLYSYSQDRNYGGHIEAQAGITTDNHVPLWIRSNQFGSVPLSGPSVSLIGSAYKKYNQQKPKVLDWGAGFTGRLNAGNDAELLLIEGYGKVKIGVFQLLGGRVKEVQGLADTLLSSGNFSISGNALGVPKIELSIPEFYSLSFLKDVVAIKGSYAHGWFGNLPIHFPYRRVEEARTFLHQKSLYLRFGSPASSSKFYLGINDNVQWGNHEKIFPKNEFTLSPWQEYYYAVVSKRFEYSQVGNHIGSFDVALQSDIKNVRMTVYRQSFYDKDALFHLANIADGLNGISFSNLNSEEKSSKWKKFVFEVLYTKNQAAGSVARLNLLGNEDYYNNYIYASGWSYKGIGLGNPLLTSKSDARENLPKSATEYFINNRVLALHLAALGTLEKINYKVKLSYSANYGTYSTQADFGTRNQFSALVDLDKNVRPKLKVGLIAATDGGQLLPNSQALFVKVSRIF